MAVVPWAMRLWRSRGAWAAAGAAALARAHRVAQAAPAAPTVAITLALLWAATAAVLLAAVPRERRRIAAVLLLAALLAAAAGTVETLFEYTLMTGGLPLEWPGFAWSVYAAILLAVLFLGEEPRMQEHPGT